MTESKNKLTHPYSMATPKKKTTDKAPVAKKTTVKAPAAKASKKTAAPKVQEAADQSKMSAKPQEPNPIEKLAAELNKNPEWVAFVESQHKKLLDLKDQLLDNLSGVARDTLRVHPEGSEASGSGEHTADAGSDSYDREFALSLLSQGQDSLYEIEDALDRIKHGVYGICEMSFQQIPQVRLEAIPFARLTVECQAQWEKEHSSRSRFRPQNRGFGYSDGQIDLESSPVLLDEDEE